MPKRMYKCNECGTETSNTNTFIHHYLFTGCKGTMKMENIYSESDLLALKEKTIHDLRMWFCDDTAYLESEEDLKKFPCGCCESCGVIKQKVDAVFDSLINGVQVRNNSEDSSSSGCREGSIPSSPSYCHHIWNTSGHCVLCGKKRDVEYK